MSVTFIINFGNIQHDQLVALSIILNMFIAWWVDMISELSNRLERDIRRLLGSCRKIHLVLTTHSIILNFLCERFLHDFPE